MPSKFLKKQFLNSSDADNFFQTSSQDLKNYLGNQYKSSGKHQSILVPSDADKSSENSESENAQENYHHKKLHQLHKNIINPNQIPRKSSKKVGSSNSGKLLNAKNMLLGISVPVINNNSSSKGWTFAAQEQNSDGKISTKTFSFGKKPKRNAPYMSSDYIYEMFFDVVNEHWKDLHDDFVIALRK